jgi:murein DD-endopeptidase MepM/ murein hydrolase activator NlpD
MYYRHVKLIASLVVILILIGGFWFFGSLFDIGKPEIKINPEIAVVGRNKVIEVSFSDRSSGLNDASIIITQGEKMHTLYSARFPKKETQYKTISVAIEPYAMKLQDGSASLIIKATDHSLFKNQTTQTKPLTIDMQPPQIYLQTPQNIINPGGTCVTLYQTSKPTVSGGVYVDDSYFPSYTTTLSGKTYSIVYFSLPITAGQGTTRIRLVVQDQAGNESSLALPHMIRKKKFRTDKISLSDHFLQQKMPEFQMADAKLRGKTLVETFVFVNETMRRDNFKIIRSVSMKSEARQLWTDTFLRMKNASPMALFGDRRVWLYNGQTIGESLHEGVDLASLERAPIEAANDGRVVFSGSLGIYGNAVMIDHGFGLCSLYAHLSTINVKAGQTVKKQEVIGNSGMTGLAGGDHLHFSMIVGGQFVNPLEWWDPHWIADNITRKIAQAN